MLREWQMRGHVGLQAYARLGLATIASSHAPGLTLRVWVGVAGWPCLCFIWAP
jgi:hypothetical protein